MMSSDALAMRFSFSIADQAKCETMQTDSDEAMRKALENLCGGLYNPARRKEVAAKLEMNEQGLYQILFRKPDSRTKKPKGVGPKLRAKLDEKFPDWLSRADVVSFGRRHDAVTRHILELLETATEEERFACFLAVQETLFKQRAMKSTKRAGE